MRAVLCDLDDTLFDHRRGTRRALESLRALEPALAVWPMDELDARHRVVLEKWHLEVMAGRVSIDQARLARFGELLRAAGGADVDRRAPAAAAAYREEYARVWEPVPGAVELLAAIREAGPRVAIVTNNVVVEQVLKLERCGLAPHVDALVTSEEVGVQKPGREIFDTALTRIGVTPDRAVMFGDAWHTDIVGAQRAGVRPVWFNRFGAASPDPAVEEIRALTPVHDAVRVLVRSMSR